MDSLWINSVPNILEKSNKLNEDLDADICIVGGGITGITCAYKLAKYGFKVVILEKDKIATRASGNTTAKITSQHGLFYKYLIDTFSADYAKDYLCANEDAIKDIKNIIDDEKIDCDFEYQDAFVYTTSDKEVQKIKDEVDAVNSLNCISAEFVTNIPLKIKNVLGAIKFPNQAQFHPRKYIKGLCNLILKNGGIICENTKVLDIEKDKDGYITHTENNIVKSKYVILTTKYPIINAPGYYFLKMYQQTSYIIAIETSMNTFDGIYISSEEPTFSFRTALHNGNKIVLVGGADHKTGAKIDLLDSYKILEQKAKELFPDAKVLYRWNTEDCIPLDKIPYIGEFSNLMPNFYVATGFKKWGMTSSNVAANIITDMILGHKNKYENIFKSTRFHPIKNKQEFGNMLKETTHSLILNKLDIPTAELKDVDIDNGKIIDLDGKKIGVYKDKNGEFYFVKPVCTHLGCELSWNNLDKTWDCPCHGSRYDYNGNLIYGPSVKNLETLE